MPPLSDQPPSGREYWRSLDHLADTPEFRRFMHHEFPAGAAELLEGPQRRHFLKIMAASMALAGMGLSGCRRWPAQKIAPFASRPRGRVPGAPQYYATCMEIGGEASGLLVNSVDGRPVKIEGNPQHPVNRGATDVFAQASVLGLYDPDRSRAPRHHGELSDWEAFAADVTPRITALRNGRGAGFAVLSEATASPTVLAMRQRLLQQLPQATWHEYEPVNNDHELRGVELALGAPHRPRYDVGAARVIVSLDHDLLFGPGDALRHIRSFAAGRRVSDEGTMNRLYCFESRLSLTGSNADHRLAVRSSDVAVIAAWLAGRLLEEPSLQAIEQDQSAAAVLDEHARVMLEHALADLRAHRGASLVVAGPRQPAEVHLLAHAMNAALGNVGTTVRYAAMPGAAGHAQSIAELARAIDAGRVNTLLIIGGNPAYNAPADLDFAGKLRAIAQRGVAIHLAETVDETSALCGWHLNRAHELESWGDARAADGTLSLQQPLIMPLFGGRTPAEVLALLTGDELTDAYDLVRRTFQELTGAGDFERLWQRTLHDGLLSGSAFTAEARPLQGDAIAPAAAALRRQRAAAGGGLEVVFVPDYSLYDGRFANNGWLQELPDPLTKLTWDNAVIMGVATAAELDVKQGDLVSIAVGDRRIEGAAAFILPGHAEGSLTLTLGYGRTTGGRIAFGSGFDFYPLRTTATMGFATGATAQRAGGRYKLATTQDHHSIAAETTGGEGVQKRLPWLVREGTLDEFREHPDFAQHRAHVVHRLSLWDENLPFHEPEGGLRAPYSWGMSIDLNACVGCNACVIACQAENNVPIVGKDQVLMGREMHWLRLDRYFRFGRDAEGNADANDLEGVALAPVPCMHCENAPCEQVCPVAATVHDKDGLNVMVYNRCIGTRYCSNNCPYKVRRFNYFDYHRRDPARQRPGMLLQVETDYYTKAQADAGPLRQMQFNPEVTVRVRGVMEKCTFCVQRIQAAKIEAKNRWVKLPADHPGRAIQRAPIEDGTIQTACQQACPAEAIVFGDLLDRESAVAQLHRNPRSYGMLEEINTKPRTRYLARLRNPAFGAAPAGSHGHGAEAAEAAH